MKKDFDKVIIYLFSALLLLGIASFVVMFFLSKRDAITVAKIAIGVNILALIIAIIGINRSNK